MSHFYLPHCISWSPINPECKSDMEPKGVCTSEAFGRTDGSAGIKGWTSKTKLRDTENTFFFNLSRCLSQTHSFGERVCEEQQCQIMYACSLYSRGIHICEKTEFYFWVTKLIKCVKWNDAYVTLLSMLSMLHRLLSCFWYINGVCELMLLEDYDGKYWLSESWLWRRVHQWV